ncbi:MAG: DUF4350 domain-containing protein [Pseudomonadota bacterium]
MNPAAFSLRTVLALVVLGTVLFLGMLWMIGAGRVHGSTNDGGAHGSGKGLAGYAALGALLDRQDWRVISARTEAQLARPGLVVLTPPHDADGPELARLVGARRDVGPTLIVLPKWQTAALMTGSNGAAGRQGWTTLAGARSPEWPGFLNDVGVGIAPLAKAGWRAEGAAGALPQPSAVQAGAGDALIPLVLSKPGGRMLAGYVADGHRWPALDALALAGSVEAVPHRARFPLVLVFEPDLLNNYGMSRPETAIHALRLMAAIGEGAPRTVTFDLTLNGFRRSANLLTLAFTPPFVAATICLLLAALLVGWRALLRFGSGRRGPPAAAWGKRELVANAGGLVLVSGRRHLLSAPYAALVRDRLARKLAIPRIADTAATEAAIDRALLARAPGSDRFSDVAGKLRAARRPADLLQEARALHALERILTR